MEKFGEVLTYRDTEKAKGYVGKRCYITNTLKYAENCEHADFNMFVVTILEGVIEGSTHPFKEGDFFYQFCVQLIEDEEIEDCRGGKENG